MGQLPTKNMMQELKLYGMLQIYEDRMVLSTKQKWEPQDLVDSLIQAEYDSRQTRQMQNRIKKARLPRGVRLEDYDFTAKRSITKEQIKNLCKLDWLTQGRPLLLVGQTGIGKSFTAEALARFACQHRKTSLFLSTTEFIELLNQARLSGQYLKERARLSKPDVLVIDDFGMRKMTSTEAQDLKEILEERFCGKSTIITTQLPLTHWAEVIEDQVILDAIVDLIEHPAITINFTGESYRKIKAKMLDSKKQGD